MHHSIQASIDGNSVHPLSFMMQTDVHSFCYSGQITLLDQNLPPIHQGASVLVRVNGVDFVFIVETITHEHVFNQKRQILSGRSITALLSKDYAMARPIGAFDQYASQMVADQLQNLPIRAQFLLTDYIIKAQSIDSANKSIIALLSEIATAAGGFLYSDPATPSISLLPRYSVPAWQQKDATATVIAADALLSLSKTVQKAPLYDNIALIGPSFAAVVYRRDLGQQAEAPTIEHALYANQESVTGAGVAALCDSGNKTLISVQMPFIDHLPQIGALWQIDHTIAQITAVQISIDAQSDAIRARLNVDLVAHMDK